MRHPRTRWLSVVLLGVLAAGCVSHTHVVGLGPTGAETVSARQYYWLFGLIEVNDVDAQRMAGDLTSYSIETRFGFVDFLLLPVLLPLLSTSRTVTVKT